MPPINVTNYIRNVSLLLQDKAARSSRSILMCWCCTVCADMFWMLCTCVCTCASGVLCMCVCAPRGLGHGLLLILLEQLWGSSPPLRPDATANWDYVHNLWHVEGYILLISWCSEDKSQLTPMFQCVSCESICSRQRELARRTYNMRSLFLLFGFNQSSLFSPTHIWVCLKASDNILI